MVTTVRWRNAFSTVFVNAPAFNNPNALQIAFWHVSDFRRCLTLVRDAVNNGQISEVTKPPLMTLNRFRSIWLGEQLKGPPLARRFHLDFIEMPP
jgi:hypothetical protein